MTRVGDTFCRKLKEEGEDFDKLYAFTELVEPGYKNRVPDVVAIPVGLKKMKEFGIKHPIIEVDFVYSGIDYEKFTPDDIDKLLSDRMGWVRKNLSKEARIFINLRDFPAAMSSKPERIFQVVHYLSSLPQTERPFGLMYEDPSGKYMPEQLGVWTAAIRKEMDDCGFKAKMQSCWYMFTSDGEWQTVVCWHASPVVQMVYGQACVKKAPLWVIPVQA